jgi:hypothetical protein
MKANFVIKCYGTFRLDNEILFLLDYVSGQDLYDVIREIGILNSYDA